MTTGQCPERKPPKLTTKYKNK